MITASSTLPSTMSSQIKCAQIRCIWRTAKGAIAIASMGKRLMGVRRFQKLDSAQAQRGEQFASPFYLR